MSAPLGFGNTYALGMTPRRARAALGIRSISDLARIPSCASAFSNEFMTAPTAGPACARATRLPQRDARGMDHDLAYRALAERRRSTSTDVYTTDAEIRAYDLRVLDDDRQLLPGLRRRLLYRADLADARAGRGRGAATRSKAASTTPR